MLNRAGLWLAFSAVLFGCGEIGVQPATEPDVLDTWEASNGSGEELSPRSLQTIRRLDLEPLYRHRPTEAFDQLQTLAVEHPRSEVLFALAEFASLLGRQHEKTDSVAAYAYYYLCAGYAYHYLFDGPPETPGPAEQMQAVRLDSGPAPDSPFDPRFRFACDLYNAGLAKCIRAAQHAGQLDPRQALKLPTPDGKGFTLSVQHYAFPWLPEEFGPLLFASDYRVVGLANHYRTYGLGVPLIGTRVAGPAAPGHAFYPREVSFPVTAFFRFEGSVAELHAHRAGRLELHNPLALQTVTIHGRPVPLETDLTTPLAYFLAHSDLKNVPYVGFVEPDKVEAKSGIYMFEPYEPGKIPVLMIHGLLSSPLTWAPMFNDLRADPRLRERFQFWFYLYPTGSPYLDTAADLRQALTRLRQELDPQGRDAALDHMVLVGHSMGGLVSHLMTVDSGDDFWHLVSDEPFEQVKMAPRRADLGPMFFFRKQPGIGRVIFIATPHRGSKLSPAWPGRLAAHLVELPAALRHSTTDLHLENPGLERDKLPTSVDMLAPGAPALMLLVNRPRPTDVIYHSIIGQAPPHNPLLEVTSALGDAGERSDGAVPYASAHIDDVASEIVVPADHNQVHQHPRAVEEVRRILLEHWRATHADGAAAR